MNRRDTSWIMEAILWPKLFRLVCQYCACTQSRGGVDVDGVYSHKKCHMEACR